MQLSIDEQQLFLKAKAVIDSYRIYYGVIMKDLRFENGLYVVYVSIPKLNRAPSSKIAAKLKDELNEVLKQLGVDTEHFYFKVKYKTE